MLRLLRASTLFGLICAPLLAQMAFLPEPAIPADPLELVTGDAQPVQDVNQRASAIEMLTNAYRHGSVRPGYPYDLKTNFTAFGSTNSDGAWQMENTSPGSGLYRWTAQGPSYSVQNLYKNRLLYSNQPTDSLPLRLTQVREAIFFSQPMLGPYASLRTASAMLNGAELVCVLVAHSLRNKNAGGGRHWDDQEYCVDPKLNNIVTYSPIPGLYVLYDYSKGLQFHDREIANKFTITQGGHTIIEAETESVGDAKENPAVLDVSGLSAVGMGSIMTAPWRMRALVPTSGVSNGGGQMVVLHGVQSSSGHLSDVEVIASTNTSLNSAALEYAAAWKGGLMGRDVEPGATPQSHEVFLMLQYVAPRDRQSR